MESVSDVDVVNARRPISRTNSISSNEDRSTKISTSVNKAATTVNSVGSQSVDALPKTMKDVVTSVTIINKGDLKSANQTLPPKIETAKTSLAESARSTKPKDKLNKIYIDKQPSSTSDIKHAFDNVLIKQDVIQLTSASVPCDTKLKGNSNIKSDRQQPLKEKQPNIHSNGVTKRKIMKFMEFEDRPNPKISCDRTLKQIDTGGLKKQMELEKNGVDRDGRILGLNKNAADCSKLVIEIVKEENSDTVENIKAKSAVENIKSEIVGKVESVEHQELEYIEKVEPTETQCDERKGVKHCLEDTINADDTKPEDNRKKKKLNIQEYLKRKQSLQTGEGAEKAIKTEPLEKPNSQKLSHEQTNSHLDCKKEENSTNFNGEKLEEGECVEENAECMNKAQSLYEEIIIVSMGCNTDISIPEVVHPAIEEATSPSATAEKSTILLSSLIGTLSSSSLISSIHDVILKKTTEIKNCSSIVSEGKSQCVNGETGVNEAEEPEHGENKIIMHLPKDRVKIQTGTISTQTEPYFQFLPLRKLSPLPKCHSRSSTDKDRKSVVNGDLDAAMLRKTRRRKDGQRKTRNYRQPNQSESSCQSDEDRCILSVQRGSSRPPQIHGYAYPSYSSNSISSKGGHTSRYDSHFNRNRTVSRSLSETSNSSNSSRSSSSSTSSSSGSSVTSKSLNSYGGSSSKSYFVDDGYDRRPNYDRRPRSNQSNRSNRSNRSNLSRCRQRRSASPGKWICDL